MKLASFVHQGKERIGAAVGDTALLDLQSHWPADQAVPVSMVDLIERGEQGLQHAAGVLAQAEDVELIDIGEVDWLPPVVKPAKICGIAMNNSASNARKIAAPDHPAFFIKPSSCLAGHQQPLVMRTYYGSMHPEPELAVVIGRTTRDVDAVDAYQKRIREHLEADRLPGSVCKDVVDSGLGKKINGNFLFEVLKKARNFLLRPFHLRLFYLGPFHLGVVHRAIM